MKCMYMCLYYEGWKRSHFRFKFFRFRLWMISENWYCSTTLTGKGMEIILKGNERTANLQSKGYLPMTYNKDIVHIYIHSWESCGFQVLSVSTLLSLRNAHFEVSLYCSTLSFSFFVEIEGNKLSKLSVSFKGSLSYLAQ